MSEVDEFRFGIVQFDDPQDATSGWACVAKGEPFRISASSELATDTIWWTNVTYEWFYSKTGLWHNPQLRHDRYLVVGPHDVMREWGYDPKTAGINDLTNICSIAFDRIMRMSWMLMRDVNPKLKIARAFSGKTLREDLRALLPELDYPRGEAAAEMKSGQAWEEFTPTGIFTAKGSSWVTLRKPRLSYAMEMLQTPVPKGPFEFLSRADLREMTGGGDKERVEFIKHCKRPCMVEVTINQFDPKYAPIYGFSNAISKDKKVTRSWVTQVEFINLCRFADVDVRNVWMGAEYWAMVPDLPASVKDFLDDGFSDTSWTAGVIGETIWRSVVLREEKGKSGPLRADEESAATSWPGLWMRGADKSSMVITALRLAELGYTVVAYGMGWIRCAVVDEELKQYINDGLSMGLVPQLLDIRHGDFSLKHMPWNGEPRSRQLAGLTVGRRDHLLWNLDRLPLMPFGERAANSQRMVEEARRRGS